MYNRIFHFSSGSHALFFLAARSSHPHVRCYIPIARARGSEVLILICTQQPPFKPAGCIALLLQLGSLHLEKQLDQFAYSLLTQDAYPQASSLEVLPHHLACVGIEGLSFSQLEALEVLHHSALARIAEAKLELARVQERLKSSEKSRLEEELRCRRLQLESKQAHAANSIPYD
ncbi:hypothetical protein DUNSADRAFT_17753 [Dunaliella salina]|uniref:Uncharacterized protein n=1 Tax=Dunaliella salina TaxID=3046 RepID=A0ABQ7G1A5_DUNSA|nr:hypothetical protein DUNSADRAFT_17753 [Dunaliella salina]KAF5828356.1 hypothetical protein DUNSADRAFT_17753 [Dunaliella salina]|eukprot:KAF5828355.1 hypothetical protein DUNSADRAFT_17753 [Dunaliella salina]